MLTVAVLAAALVICVLAAWGAKHVRTPEETAIHPDQQKADTASDSFYRTDDRPAGPDAEGPLPFETQDRRSH